MIFYNEPEKFNKKFDVVSVFVEHDGKLLLLLRQDHKPQGNTWGVVAGKVEAGEDELAALVREVEEEIGLKTRDADYKFFQKIYVKYPDFDFVYYMYHLPVLEKPTLNINKEEHKDFTWISPTEALALNLIEDEDACIKSFYDIK